MDPVTLTALAATAAAAGNAAVAAAPYVALVGSAVTAGTTIAGAKAQSQGLNYQADVAKVKGVQERAANQRKQMETQRQTQLVQSKLQANASASGAGATDPTVVDLATNIAGRGEYQGALDMWNGDMAGWNYDTQASADQYQGNALTSIAPFSAAGTVLGGVGSAFRGYAYTASSSSPIPNLPYYAPNDLGQ